MQGEILAGTTSEICRFYLTWHPHSCLIMYIPALIHKNVRTRGHKGLCLWSNIKPNMRVRRPACWLSVWQGTISEMRRFHLTSVYDTKAFLMDYAKSQVPCMCVYLHVLARNPLGWWKVNEIIHAAAGTGRPLARKACCIKAIPCLCAKLFLFWIWHETKYDCLGSDCVI